MSGRNAGARPEGPMSGRNARLGFKRGEKRREQRAFSIDVSSGESFSRAYIGTSGTRLWLAQRDQNTPHNSHFEP